MQNQDSFDDFMNFTREMLQIFPSEILEHVLEMAEIEFEGVYDRPLREAVQIIKIPNEPLFHPISLSVAAFADNGRNRLDMLYSGGGTVLLNWGGIIRKQGRDGIERATYEGGSYSLNQGLSRRCVSWDTKERVFRDNDRGFQKFCTAIQKHGHIDINITLKSLFEDEIMHAFSFVDNVKDEGVQYWSPDTWKDMLWYQVRVRWTPDVSAIENSLKPT